MEERGGSIFNLKRANIGEHWNINSLDCSNCMYIYMCTYVRTHTLAQRVLGRNKNVLSDTIHLLSKKELVYICKKDPDPARV